MGRLPPPSHIGGKTGQGGLKPPPFESVGAEPPPPLFVPYTCSVEIDHEMLYFNFDDA